VAAVFSRSNLLSYDVTFPWKNTNSIPRGCPPCPSGTTVMKPRHDPTPVARRTRCPVCKKAVYSLAGIHPQCAMAQATPPKPNGETQGDSHFSDGMTCGHAEATTGDDPRPTATPVAEIIGVPLRMIGLWIDTGAWPLPCSVCGGTSFFRLSDLECWLKTGAWPTGAHFRKGPRRPSGRWALLHSARRGDERRALRGRRPHGGMA
jgi:hypothetical protein